MRVAFGVLERTAPAIAAAWAERLWYTVPAVPASARRARLELPAGTEFTIDQDGRTVRGTIWDANSTTSNGSGSAPTVYLVHGWGGWRTQLAAYVPPLVAAGFRVIGYDALSHGDSDPGRDGPRRTALPEIAETLHGVVAEHGPADAVIAHSVGAAVTAQAMRTGLAPKRLVFVAAANSFDVGFDIFGQTVGYGPRTGRRLRQRFVRRWGVGTQHFEVAGIGAELLARDGTLPPLLAIHDRDDRETPYEGAIAITEGWPDAVLRTTEGLGHRRALWHPDLVAEAVEFVAGVENPDTRPGRTSRHDTMAG